MTSPLEKWPILIRGELKIRLEFERNSLDECYNYSECSNKPNEDDQIIRIRGAAAIIDIRRQCVRDVRIITSTVNCKKLTDKW